MGRGTRGRASRKHCSALGINGLLDDVWIDNDLSSLVDERLCHTGTQYWHKEHHRTLYAGSIASSI